MSSEKPHFRWFSDRQGWYLWPELETPMEYKTHQLMDGLFSLCLIAMKATGLP